MKNSASTPISIKLYRLLSYPHPYRMGLMRLLPSLFPRYRPQYYSCMFEAAKTAQALGYKKFSVLEFGVAGGNGLVAIEKYATLLERKFGIEIEIYGFDMGDNVGLPKTTDFRDQTWFWKEAAYKMDQPKLEKKINHAKLIIGNLAETAEGFISKYEPAPIGCVFVDLDYYTSTASALKILAHDPENYLPRIPCYFDDLDVSNTSIGELGAVEDYNKTFTDRKILKTYGHYESSLFGAFHSAVFTFHAFEHPQYSQFVGHHIPQELSL